MSKKTDPLGRGLDTILGGSNAQYTTPAAQQIVADYTTHHGTND